MGGGCRGKGGGDRGEAKFVHAVHKVNNRIRVEIVLKWLWGKGLG